ncbi:hypothetical protein M4I32_08700 [Microbacterium sp. LRZ72]|uniref:hypothetical protein n=1 Tax=Microbacterium sp. LRZ72 TaxID=2942481 RepID=UPI0029B44C4B|nr:hypothetical protein [Microbacterium sp. LRZ72]MDX2376875.1 hypothetical protein [Microbacterium sp. LRZ72]
MVVRMLFVLAAGAYAAACALGTAVALRVVDTTNHRRVHHALYIATVVLGAVASGAALVRGPRAAAALLAPAAVPLGVIPYAGTRGRRHPALALAAAPFFAMALRRSVR